MNYTIKELEDNKDKKVETITLKFEDGSELNYKMKSDFESEEGVLAVITIGNVTKTDTGYATEISQVNHTNKAFLFAAHKAVMQKAMEEVPELFLMELAGGLLNK